MGDDRESEQRQEAPTTPDTGDTEPPDSGDQADDQSNEASVPSQQPTRRRFLPRLRKRRTTDNAEQAVASTEQPAKKSKIGLLGIVVTAAVGFFFGIGSNQVTDYVKRADDCDDALSLYSFGVASNFESLEHTQHDQSLTPDQRNAAGKQYNTIIALPHLQVQNKCPIGAPLRPGGPDPGRPPPEYLNSDEVNHWKAIYYQLSMAASWRVSAPIMMHTLAQRPWHIRQED